MVGTVTPAACAPQLTWPKTAACAHYAAYWETYVAMGPGVQVALHMLLSRQRVHVRPLHPEQLCTPQPPNSTPRRI